MTQIVKTIHRQMPYIVEEAKRKALGHKAGKRWVRRHISREVEGRQPDDLERYKAVVELNKRHGIDPPGYWAAKRAVPEAIRRNRFGRKVVSLAKLRFVEGV